MAQQPRSAPGAAERKQRRWRRRTQSQHSAEAMRRAIGRDPTCPKNFHRLSSCSFAATLDVSTGYAAAVQPLRPSSTASKGEEMVGSEELGRGGRRRSEDERKED
eukprot:1306672-Rhodomonas_salina.4